MNISSKCVLMLGVSYMLSAPVFAQSEVKNSNTGATGTSAASANATAADQASTTSATAAATPPSDPGDIIVTAQRRAERLQRVPIAVSAITGDDLAQVGVTDINGLAPRVPSFNMGQQVGGAKITIRGIGLDTLTTGAESPVAFHQDGVFIQRTAAAVASFFDIQRVEVLRGPQGTLYGRNATGGAINVITRDPTADLDGYLRLTVGNYDYISTEGAIGGQLAEGVRMRIAFRTGDRDGFGKNIVTGNKIDNEHERAIRGKLEFLPTDKLTILLEGDYTHANDRNNGSWHYYGQGAPNPVPLGVVFGGVLPTSIRDIATEYDPYRKLDAEGVAATISYDLGFATLKSITAWRHTQWRSRLDLDATSFQLFSPMDFYENSHQFSQEIDLAGSSRNTNWVAGYFHFNEHDVGITSAPIWNGLFLPPALAFVSQGYYAGSYIQTAADAAFAQVTQHLTQQLSVTVGGRYSTERKSVVDQQAIDLFTPVANPIRPIFNPAAGIECSAQVQSLPICVPSKRWSAFTPKVGVEYQLSPATMVYASATKGFRSGIYSLGAVQAPVDPEFVWSYEIGLKSRMFDNRLRANLAGFYYDYTNLQVTKAAGTQTVMENAATARVYGLEAEITAQPVRAVQFDFTGSYLNAKFTKYVSADPARPLGDGHTLDKGVPAFDLSGNTLPQSPKVSFLAGAQYDLGTTYGKFTLRGEVNYTSRVYFSAFNRPEVSVASKTRLNAYLNFVTTDGKWNISLVGRNLANKVAATNAYVTTALVGYIINANIEQPRTITLSVGYNF